MEEYMYVANNEEEVHVVEVMTTNEEEVHVEQMQGMEEDQNELQIIIYTFDDGHVEVYEDALILLFDDSIADTIPHYSVLIRGEMAKPLDLPGNCLIPLMLADGTEYGEPLDEQVVEELATGCTSDILAVFNRELALFPEHQFVYIQVDLETRPQEVIEPEVELEPSPPAVSVRGSTTSTYPRRYTSATSARRPSFAVRARGSSKSLTSRHLLDGKEKASLMVMAKNNLGGFQPNADQDPRLRVANVGDVDGEGNLEVAVKIKKVSHKKKSKNEQAKTSKTTYESVVPSPNVIAQMMPIRKKKSVKRKKTVASCDSSPKERPRGDPSMMAARCSPRLKSLDEISRSPVKPPKKVKKVNASKSLPHAKASSRKTVEARSSQMVETNADLKKIPPACPEPLPKPIPTPVPILVKPAESEPALLKAVPVRPPIEQTTVDIASKSNKELPRHQSLRIALQTFRNQDVQGNEDFK